jgi:hypothetical protein
MFTSKHPKAIAGVLLLLSAALLPSCSESSLPEAGNERTGALTPIIYPNILLVLSDGSYTPPADKATFTFVSYMYNDLTGDYETEPRMSSAYPVGSYAYRTAGGGIAGSEGIMEPCAVDATDYSYVSRDPSKGQGLLAGAYRTFIIHPAAPLKLIADMDSYRVKIKRDATPVISASDTFISFKVTGYNTFPIPQDARLKLKDVRSRISIQIIQRGTTFTIEDPKLLNAGYTGWYHPSEQTTDIGYDSNPANEEDVTPAGEPPYSAENLSTILASTGQTGEDEVVYKTPDAGIYVFAADYSSPSVAELQLAFTLSMSDNDFPITIPFAIPMKAATHYHFTLSVESEIIKVGFEVVQWGEKVDESYDLGGSHGPFTMGEWELNVAAWTTASDHDIELDSGK